MFFQHFWEANIKRLKIYIIVGGFQNFWGVHGPSHPLPSSAPSPSIKLAAIGFALSGLTTLNDVMTFHLGIAPFGSKTLGKRYFKIADVGIIQEF